MYLNKASNEKKNEWYVMRATYGRELKAKDIFTENSIECFIPMRHKVLSRNGKKEKKLVPAINNLIFIKSTSEEILKFRPQIPYVKFIYNTENQKLVVPNSQMEQFIKISETNDESLMYFDPKEINLKEGTPIRIHGKNTAFDGVEGVFIKVRGKRNKQLVVSLNGIIAIAATVDIDLIEEIKS